MSKKLVAVLVGALVFFVVQWIVGFLVTGPLIHERALMDDYQANSEFWRPELSQEPPDMTALLPMWITNGLICALLMTVLYLWIRGGFKGAGWLKGLKYGLFLALVMACFCLGWWGIFGLPGTIWTWWAIEAFIYLLPAGAALGWVTGKLAPE